MPRSSPFQALILAASVALAAPVQAQAQTQPQERLTIASSLPLTGGSAWYGNQGRNGALLAVEEVNAAGGVLGAPVAIDFLDNRCNPAEGVKSLTQALAEKRYSALHEGGCSSVALAVMPVIARAGVPFVIGSPSATSITAASGVGGNPWAFKIIPNDVGMLSALVKWIDDQGKSGRVAFVGEDTDYGRSGAKAFDEALQTHGKKLLSQDFYQQGTSDFTNLFTRLKASRPSLVAAYIIGADSQNYLRQWFEFGGGVGLTGRIFTDQIPDPIITSGALDGMAVIHPYDIHLDTPENKAFVARYQARFGSLPNLTSWVSYEGVRVIAEAARAAGSADPARLRDAIRAGRFTTILGDTIAFDDHHLAHLDALIIGVDKGRVVVLGRAKT